MATNERSPNYPAHGLQDMLGAVDKLYKAERRASVPHLSAAKAIGYTSLSGRARVKISTMRKFGLVEEAGGRVRVSDLAMRYLFPTSDSARQDAIEEAAWKPDLFREIASNAEASDSTLVNDLVQRGFTFDGAKQAVASFRETMSLVGPSDPSAEEPEVGYDRVMDSPRSIATSGSTGPGLLNQRPTRHEGDRAQADFSWPLPGGVRVELKFAGGPFTKDGLRLLRKYLDVLEEAIPEAADVASPSPPAEPIRSEPPS